MDDNTPSETGILTEQVSTIECFHCGTAIDVSARPPFEAFRCPECDTEQKVPARFGPFLLLDLLGRGGMGGVYLGRDESLGRPVAIKVMLQSVGENEALVETFKREARAAAKLNHPHVAQIYSFGQERGQPYIVMELISGKSLDLMIENESPLDQTFVMRVGCEIAEGLRAADEVGLVHGDIKPENILFDDKSKAKLVDFGIATFTGQADAGSIWGTPYYIAPEKIRRQKIDARSDIYSLGATLYHALAGKPPFEGETPVEVVKARLNTTPAPLREVRPDTNEGVEQIVGRMLEVEPGRRYPTYASLLGDMKKALREIRQSRPAATSGSKRIRIKKRGTPTAKSEAAQPGAPAHKKPKLVIRTSAARRPAVESRQAPAKKEASPRDRVRTERVMKGIAFGCLAVILLVGLAGGGVYYWLRHEATLLMRREKYDLARYIGTATNAYAGVADTAAKLTERAASAAAMETRATNAVATILEEPLGPLPVADEPPAAAPAAASAPAEGGDGGEEAQPEPPAAEPAATNVGAATNQTPVAAGQPADAVEPGSLPGPVDVSVELAELPDLSEHPEARQMGWRILVRVQAITTAVVVADAALQEATEQRNRVLQVKTSVAAESIAGRLRDRAAAFKELADKQRKWIVESRDLLKGLEREMQRALSRREAERAAREAAQREQAERERLERERLAREAKVKQELDAAAAAGEAAKTRLAKNEFNTAAKELTAKQRELETEEGRAALKIHIERYERLQKLRQFLVAQLQKHKMRWGYGFGANAIDVTGADKESVHARGRKIPWNTISAAQMIKFINHFLMGKRGRSLPPKTAAEQLVGAAIYCYLHNGLDAARTYSDEARRLDFHQGETLRRVVPME